MKRVKKRIGELSLAMESKIEGSKFYGEMSGKMEREEVLQLIPDPSDYKQSLEELMLVETEKLVKTVTGMTKSLDLKIVKLRNDVNLPKLNKILKEKADL